MAEEASPGLATIGAGLQLFSTFENLRLQGIQNDLNIQLAQISAGAAHDALASLRGGSGYHPDTFLADPNIDWGMGLAELSRRELSRQKEAFEGQYGRDVRTLDIEREGMEINRLKQRSQMALQKGETGLARSEAAKAARLESAAARAFNAAAGASAFTRAIGQLSINKVSSIDQRLVALMNEGLLQEEEANLVRQQFGIVEEKLQQTYNLGLEGFSDSAQKLEINIKLQELNLHAQAKAAWEQKLAAEKKGDTLGGMGLDFVSPVGGAHKRLFG